MRHPLMSEGTRAGSGQDTTDAGDKGAVVSGPERGGGQQGS